MTFVHRHPTIVLGGALLLVMILIAIFAPCLGTVDPTALAPAKRTREPSALYWFGTDMLGRDVYSRVHLRRAGLADRRLLGGDASPRWSARSSAWSPASSACSMPSSCG